MPFTGHLKEFRQRLILSLVVLVLSASLAFYFSADLLALIKRPLDAQLIFLSPAEAFWSDLKVSLFFGFLCAFPVILFEFWKFVSPGLLASEKGILFPFFSIGLFFFYGGISFCYFLALPFALEFLIAYGRDAGIEPLISVSMYVDFNLKMLIAFGLIFELPLIMVILSMMGFLTPDFLSKNRKYAVLGAFVIAAIATPTPDMFNQLVMALPLILLYEVGIITVRLFGGRRAAAKKERERV